MIYVISGPSGCGKSTLIKNLLTVLPGLQFSVSYTTRPVRQDEVEGRDYYFVTREKFEEMKEGSAFWNGPKCTDIFTGPLWTR